LVVVQGTMACSRVIFWVALVGMLAWCAHASLPDVGKDMADIVSEKGYPIEEYHVVTADNYTLGMFRIPYGRGQEPPTTRRPAVILQHGLEDSSYTWVNNFPTESLGFLLADAGYDVWLPNSRGNYYSTPPNPSDSFWAFTWDEMAKYDLPANVDFVLQATGLSTVSYVGHSQGTTQAFAGFSLDAELQSKVNFFGALAPVAYVDHEKSLLLRILADLDAVVLFELLGVRDFLPDASLLQKLAPGLCSLIPWGCEDFLFLIVGPSHNLNETRIPVYVSETPAGTSTMNIAHWCQGVKVDKFQMYDYGCGLFSCDNIKHYGQKTPPAYDLSKVTVPTALYAGTEDDLADLTDVQTLIDQLPDSTVVHHDTIQGFAHLDFTWGKDANTLVYADLMKRIAQYASTA